MIHSEVHRRGDEPTNVLFQSELHKVILGKCENLKFAKKKKKERKKFHLFYNTLYLPLFSIYFLIIIIVFPVALPLPETLNSELKITI